MVSVDLHRRIRLNIVDLSWRNCCMGVASHIWSFVNDIEHKHEVFGLLRRRVFLDECKSGTVLLHRIWVWVCDILHRPVGFGARSKVSAYSPHAIAGVFRWSDRDPDPWTASHPRDQAQQSRQYLERYRRGWIQRGRVAKTLLFNNGRCVVVCHCGKLMAKSIFPQKVRGMPSWGKPSGEILGTDPKPDF